MNESCAHCGNPCEEDLVRFEDKTFCCQGCSAVYQLLHDHRLENYYRLEQQPGISGKRRSAEKYDYLDLPEIRNALLEYSDESTQVVLLALPSIHCSSCIWLLEHLHRLHPGVKRVVVNFPRREARITYHPEELSLRRLAELLNSIGYAPDIKLESLGKKKKKHSRKELLQLGVAGFVFGNTMLLALPEYFDAEETTLLRLAPFIRGVMLALSLPVVFYSAQSYFISAYKGLRNRFMNMDVPIALGISVLFLRSAYEIFSGTGPGYLDSLAGLVFFLLLGKWYQRVTYDALNFERDYKAYFPIAVTAIRNGTEEQLPLDKVVPGDELLIRNGELLPVDAELLDDAAAIDNSFVTGESRVIPRKKGDIIHAGGRQTGGPVRVKARRTVDQSYLTQLWNHQVFQQTKPSRFSNITDRISKHFTLVLLLLALGAGIYWSQADPSRVAQVVTAVLIVACPCALALSAPFALGNTVRLMGRRKAFVKNSDTVEHLGLATRLVFDKTGTLTSTDLTSFQWEGEQLSDAELAVIKALARGSNHPLSRALARSLNGEATTVEGFGETPGWGLEGASKGHVWRLGRAEWAYAPVGTSGICISTDGRYRGRYLPQHGFREGLREAIPELRSYSPGLLTGDGNGQEAELRELLGPGAELRFNQKPEDKLQYVAGLQEQGETVVMIGDGLNDAGALQQSQVGISIAEDVNGFSPACDVILAADQLRNLPRFLRQAQKSMKIIYLSFALSFLYNILGLSFAVTGHLSPLVSAILMPLSSVTVVAFVTGSTYLADKKLWKNAREKHPIL